MFLPLAATIIAGVVATSASADCMYEATQPVMKNGQEQYLFLDPCGFHEVGYRLDGNTLHFPRGGTHTLKDTPETEVWDTLRETYGLVDAGDGNLIRTKDVLEPRG